MGTNMDGMVWYKLRADLHPTITFTLRSLDLEAEPTNPPVRVRCVAQGDLAIAGVTNAVTIPVGMLFGEADRLTVSGEFSVRMSDFLVKRPQSGITTANAADRVWISFEWRLLSRHASSAMRRRSKGRDYSRQPRPSSFLCKRDRVWFGLAAFHRAEVAAKQ